MSGWSDPTPLSRQALAQGFTSRVRAHGRRPAPRTQARSHRTCPAGAWLLGLAACGTTLVPLPARAKSVQRHAEKAGPFVVNLLFSAILGFIAAKLSGVRTLVQNSETCPVT